MYIVDSSCNYSDGQTMPNTAELYFVLQVEMLVELPQDVIQERRWGARDMFWTAWRCFVNET